MKLARNFEKIHRKNSFGRLIPFWASSFNNSRSHADETCCFTGAIIRIKISVQKTDRN